ncbi:biliverdin-producing heme oxygenase [Granulicella cerasi]|uniref:Biliverdin-producing heme oxygenase n=1 Tax=Granulicella cerasi TaxID=741063 RepID=A0ABW1Z9S2_9BACT|nr:biliverdin-producing heme oxygenase [Granulicella cerasi]
MDLQLLRTATMPEHQATEALMPVMKTDLTRVEYAQVLRCFAPIIAGWEAWAATHVPAEYAELIAARKRAPLLERDLAAFGEAMPAPHFVADASFSTPAGFLGAMYVVEGSTLGGQYIAKHVEPLLGIDAEHGTAYFRGYREETGARWKEFQAALLALPDDKAEEVIFAARRMFGLFREAILPLAPLASPAN